MKAWLIIGLLTAQLIVSVMIMMHLADDRADMMRLRSDMNQGLIELRTEDAVLTDHFPGKWKGIGIDPRSVVHRHVNLTDPRLKYRDSRLIKQDMKRMIVAEAAALAPGD